MLPWLPWKEGSSWSSLTTCLQDLLVLLLLMPTVAQGKIITCICTTKDCVASGVRTCNTTSMCYTQFLDKKGSEPVFRGCINNKTPLLCENRPPAIPNSKWPLLLCCQESHCNEEGLPSPPPWHLTGNQTKAAKSFYEDDEGKQVDLPPTNTSTGRTSSIITPVYIVVLVSGICLLFLIGAFAVVVLRRQSRFHGNDFGIDRSTYLKGQCTKNSVPVSKNGDVTASKNGFYPTNELLTT